MRPGVRDTVLIVLNVLPMMVAAALVTGAVYVFNSFVHWPGYVWAIASPMLYLMWLFIYLHLAGRTVRGMAAKHPKPRYCVHRPGERLTEDRRGLLTAFMCYMRLTIVETLPLVSPLRTTPSFRGIVLRAYAPSIHLGRNVTIYGQLQDPDLTEIGDDTVIGSRSVIIGHAETVRPNGDRVYITAPVRIGQRVTLGGETHVSLGCVIGDDVVIEESSFLVPFTTVPAGEVWGGNPAQFLRKRKELSDEAEPAAKPAPALEHTEKSPVAPPEEIRQLVTRVLGLPADTPADALRASSCAAWDSIGQIGIASALFDKYGITVEPQDLFLMHDLQDVAELAANGHLASARESGAPAPSAPVQVALPRDREMLPLLDPQEATRALSANPAHYPASGQKLSVVVAATFTAHPLATSLQLWANAFGYDVECHFAGYDQIVQTLLDPGSQFATNRNGVNVILARPEDFDAGTAEQTQFKADQVLDALEQYASAPSRGQQILVGTLPPLVSSFTGLDRAQAESLRNHWQTRLAKIAGVQKFEFSELVERLGVDKARDAGNEVLTRVPYSPVLFQELGIALVRSILSKRRSAAKVIAVDCDNTLWGEVVGEVGLDGIYLGADGRGRSFQLFQRALKRLKDRGLLLVVTSRNEEKDVREVFEKHPGMVLKTEDIAAWRVNWNHKSENIRELAAQLNLGLDSFVFLDDDPAVRLQVETAIPQVHVVPLPSAPAEYCEALARLWLFDGAEATEVDAARTVMAQQESLRQSELNAAGSLEEYLASLGLRVDMHPPTEQEWARVAQLTQRTNQFNLNLRRRTVEEMKAHCADRPIWTLRAKDRFGDYGLIGIAIIEEGEARNTAQLETLLMSCRAMGRGVEDAFLYGIALAAAQRGAGALVANYVEGPRNQMVLDYLRRKGFVETEPRRWELSLAPLPELPSHVEFSQSDPRAMAAAADV